MQAKCFRYALHRPRSAEAGARGRGRGGGGRALFLPPHPPTGWSYNAIGWLTGHARADTSTVVFAYDTPTTEEPLRTGHLTSVTWPLSSGSLTTTLGYRTTTGAVDTVSDSTGCMLSTVYETGVASPWEPLPVGESLGNASGGTCAVQGTVSWAVNALFEPTAMTVTGGPTGP